MFIEERNNTWNSPYLFNGKELDEDTGLYYYGARYYNPRESVWLSVDPLAEKYPNVSPYAYTFQNPVKYIDPDGNEPDCPSCKTEQQWNEYMGLWRNTFEMMGSNEWTINSNRAYSNVKAIHDDSGRFTVTVNGVVQDYEDRNWVDSFSDFYTPLIDLAAITVTTGARQSSSFISRAVNWAKGLFSNNNLDNKVLKEAKSIMKQQDKIYKAFNSGVETEFNISGRPIVVVPEAPMSGLTLFEEGGFVLGRDAFSSKQEFGKTLLHELYRLNNSALKGKNVNQGAVSQETKAAFDFAEKNVNKIVK